MIPNVLYVVTIFALISAVDALQLANIAFTMHQSYQVSVLHAHPEAGL